jgi:hypothetical protein
MSIKLRCLILLLVVLLTGCNSPVEQNKSLQKTNISLQTTIGSESAPFVWNDKLCYLLCVRNTDNTSAHFEIRDFETGNNISTFADNFFGVSCLVKNNKLYIFGSSPFYGDNNSIYMIETSDLIHFSPPVLVIKGNSEMVIFNTSVCEGPSGKYTIVYETREQGKPTFGMRFVESDDLVNWKVKSGYFGGVTYMACPTIRYSSGNYYLLWLASEEGKFITKVSKINNDFQSLTTSKKNFLYPRSGEGINNSDADLVYFKGKTYVFYGTGDQATWSNLTYATFYGTLEELLTKYF